MKFYFSFIAFFASLMSIPLLMTACLDTIEVVETVDQETLDGLSKVDTLYIKDTLVLVERMSVYDTSFIYYTVKTIDTLVQIDSLWIKDTLVQIDSLWIKDTLIINDQSVVYDTSFVYDSVFVYDTLTRIDTLVIKDTLFIKNEAHNAVSYFVSIEDIIKNLKAIEKVTFVIRHAERGDDTSISGGLNENGITQSKELGQKLAGIDDIYFMHSNFKRAVETCQYIAEGKGQTLFEHDTIMALVDSWYVFDKPKFEAYKNSNGGGWSVISRWAYTSKFSDAFYDLDEHSLFLEENYFAPSYAEMSRYSMAVSHDQVLVPFVAWATNRQVDLRQYETSKWLNYLAGVAIIVNENNEYRYIPVKGLSSGTM